MTKIIPIINSVSSAVSYITNPEKTDDQLLVSGYNCNPDFAPVKFAMIQELAREVKGDYRNTGGNEIKSYHLIQSFSPEDEITPEQVHE